MTDSTLDALRNECLRRIGRNLWCYQQVELQLKALLSVSGGVASMTASGAVIRRDIDKKAPRMMGELAGALTSEFLAPAPERSMTEGRDWLAWSLRIETDAAFSNGLREQLAVLVSERNALVHHAAERWNLHEVDLLQDALKVLDEQRERTVEVQATLRQLLEWTRDAIEAMSSYLASSEFKEHLVRAHLESALYDAVARAARADGWTPLSQVGHHFQEHVQRLPEAERRRLPKLSRLLSNSGAFELRHETTQTGGTRALCRLKETSPLPPPPPLG